VTEHQIVLDKYLCDLVSHANGNYSTWFAILECPQKIQPAYRRRVSYGRDDRCTTRQPKTHITEHREVCYRWHCCFGKSVGIKEGVNKAYGAVFRCVIDAEEFPNTLEIPKWMFDRAACALMVNEVNPSVSVCALLDLQLLLRSASTSDMLEDQRYFSKREGDADEHATRSKSSKPVKSVSCDRKVTAVAISATRSTRKCSSVDGIDAAPSSAPLRGRRRGGR
jgi:hypothetical protein